MRVHSLASDHFDRGASVSARAVPSVQPLADYKIETREQHLASIARSVAAMREDPSREFDLKTLAGIAFMSKFHFIRVFEEVTSISPSRFLCGLRLEMAKQLLLTSQLPVSQIAINVGYSSITTFTRLFTEFVGGSPSTFRSSFTTMTSAATSLSALFENHLHASDLRQSGISLRVNLSAEYANEGPVFVGVFPTGIPRSRPHSGRLLFAMGIHEIVVPTSASDGFLLAVTFRRKPDVESLFMPDPSATLVAAARISALTNDQSSDASGVRLFLRPSKWSDPPLVIALPLLLLPKIGVATPSARRPRGRVSVQEGGIQ